LTVFGLLGAALLGVVVYPPLDLIVSGWFYEPGKGFFLANEVLFIFLHHIAVKGAWILGFTFSLLTIIAFLRDSGSCGLSAKRWLFLLLALLIGPVLIANGMLKDHWGRSRPHEIVEFGGNDTFSPALSPQPDAERNGSFISGDGAFGFYLPCFAYLVPLGTRRKLSRGVFWGGMVAGGAFALSRVAMGSHFLSDNLFAALLMLASSTALHAAMFGQKLTRDYCRSWLGLND
jgi:lipid A 4'-phosphatase